MRVGDRQLALPLANVTEVFELDPAQLQRVDGRVVAAHRGRPLPLSDLAAWAGVTASVGGHVVVVQVGHQQLGLVAAEVFGREEVMVKPLGGTKPEPFPPWSREAVEHLLHFVLPSYGLIPAGIYY